MWLFTIKRRKTIDDAAVEAAEQRADEARIKLDRMHSRLEAAAQELLPKRNGAV